MKFEEVLPALRNGSRVRLKSWIEGSYIWVPKGGGVIFRRSPHTFDQIWDSDFLLADAWEIIAPRMSGNFDDAFAAYERGYVIKRKSWGLLGFRKKDSTSYMDHVFKDEDIRATDWELADDPFNQHPGS